MDTRTAKLFKNGNSQAVRLPVDFRFEGDEVYISRDAATGDVILSDRPRVRVWDEFFRFFATVEAPEEFMAERPLSTVAAARGVFDGVREA